MVAANSINESTTGICGFTGTAFVGTALTAHDVLIGGSTSSTITNVAPSATSGVPLISQGASADPTFGTAVVAGGGTGLTSATAYAVLTGGTTSTGNFQSIASVGTSGQVLTSNGAGALPTFQAVGSASGTVVQQVHTSSATRVSTGAIPQDDTIPQNTEGTQILSVSITPTNSSNILFIKATMWGYLSIANNTGAAALFQDSTANALAAAQIGATGTGAAFFVNGTLVYYMTAGTTSSTTFNIRAGSVLASSFYINGDSSNRYFGGVGISTLEVVEFKA